MHIAFVVQGLFHKSDSVGYDCVHQYLSAQSVHPQYESVRIFAQNFKKSNYKDVDIQGMDEFYSFCETQNDVLIIYHYCDGWPDFDSYIMSTHHKVVVRWHNNTPPWFFIKENLKSAESSVYGFEQIVRFISNRRICFWCNSEFSQRQLEALGASADRIETVYPASRYLTKPPAGEAPRREGAFKHSLKLLFVSRVRAHKGHKHVLAVASLVQKMLAVPVRVEFPGRLGNKEFMQRLTDLSRDLGVSMKLYGEISEEKLLDIYNDADVFVCLSEHEGFGMPIFEAMRCGIPVVAWACTALEDLLDGHILSFKNFNVKNFADAIVRLSDDNTRRRVLSEQAHILSKYTNETVLEQLRNAIAEAATKEDTSPDTFFDRDLLHENYTFDSNRNLVSLYDIENYKFFLRLLKKGQSWLPAMSAGEAGQRYGKGIRSRPGKSGQIVFGPHVSLAPGKYRLTAQLKMERGLRGIIGALRPHFKTPVLCEVVAGERCLAQRHFPALSMLKWPKVLEFAVETQMDGVEFRIWTTGKLNLRLRSVEVELVDRGPVRVA